MNISIRGYGMKTKEKILRESLKLFAMKGFNEISLNELAENVGIKAPSLYKHYKSKQDIFSHCIEYFRCQLEEKRENLSLPKNGENSKVYADKSREEIINIAIDLFKYHLLDPVASNFRKMLLKDRYNNQEIDDLYMEIFIKSPIEYQKIVFQYLMDNDYFIKDDVQTMATNFYTPIFFLIQKYDTNIESINEGEKELSEIMNDFCDRYEVKK